MPTVSELFSDVKEPGALGDRFEALKGALNDAIKRHDSGVDGFVSAKQAEAYGTNAGILKGLGAGRTSNAQRLEKLASRVEGLTKGLDATELADVTSELEALKGLMADLGKDITVASPGNLHPYDLEAPAKILVPRFTPLRNELPRQKGQGTAREYRRILGYSNTGMGGVANLTPFFNSESDSGTPTFGALALRRGQKISYAMDVQTAGYVEMSLSDLVTYKAYFSDLGFEDVRQLSQ